MLRVFAVGDTEVVDFGKGLEITISFVVVCFFSIFLTSF